MKPSKSLNGELPSGSVKGISADIKRLRGKYTCTIPIKRGMIFGNKSKLKKP